jgi:7,8-dihydroneopterin aldolase/epimerase/oxygenase
MSQTDLIFIRELKVETCLGIYHWEQRIKQTLIFDLEFSTDIQKAATSDQIDDTLDYAKIADFITHFAENRKFQLLERLAHESADLLLQHFSITDLRLKVSKPGAIANAKEVGIVIHRKSKQT